MRGELKARTMRRPASVKFVSLAAGCFLLGGACGVPPSSRPKVSVVRVEYRCSRVPIVVVVVAAVSFALT